MDDTTENRLVELEIRLAHHERMADEMSDALIAQARRIERLETLLTRLDDRLADVEQGFGPSPQDEKPPPHY